MSGGGSAVARTLVFGFGSLISAESRCITIGKLTPARYVVVEGFVREFSVNVRSRGMTALGVRPAAGGRVTGVLFEVSEDQLQSLDRREGSPYRRVRLDPSNVTVVDDKGQVDTSADAATFLKDADMYQYQAVNPRQPTKQCPVAQSYADVFIHGALSVSPDFAALTVATTALWGAPMSAATSESKNPTPTKPDGDMAATDKGTGAGAGAGAGAGGAGAGAGTASGQGAVGTTTGTGSSGGSDVHTDGAIERGTWLDDRASPMYVRASAEASAQAKVIDGLLGERWPRSLAGRQRVAD